MVDSTVIGISMQDDGASPVLLLHPTGTRHILSVGIGPLEAVAVSTALHGVTPEVKATTAAPFAHTPLAHDFLLNTVTALGAEFSAGELVGFSEGEFTARAVFTHNGANVRAVCRPADGVALALRSGAPVRCVEALLAYAKSIDAVMASLPEHVRTLAAAKLGDQRARDVPEWLRAPLAVEEAFASRARSGAVSAHDELVSVARKMFEEDDQRRRVGTAADRKGPRIVLEPKTVLLTPEKGKLSGRAPQIRMTMVRHTGKGEVEILDEFEVPPGGIPREVLVGLGLNRKEAEAVNGVAEDERWATLLRMLPPPTKVPM